MDEKDIDALVDPAIESLRRETIGKLCSECANVLRGYPPDVQGAVVGTLMALHIAGHQDGGEEMNEGHTIEEFREELLGLMVDMIRSLVPSLAEMIAKGGGTPLQ